MDDLGWELDEADPLGGYAIEIIAESPSEPDLGDIGSGCAPLLKQRSNPGGNGPLCELKLSDIGLGNGDGGCEEYRVAVGEAAVRLKHAEIEGTGGGVDETAAAEPSGRHGADYPTLELTTDEVHLSDGPCGGAHSVGDAGSFEGRSGGGGRAEEPVTVSENNLAVGAEVDQQCQLATFVHAGGENSGGEIAADETPEPA